MSIKVSLKSFLQADAAITAKLSAVDAVFHMVAPVGFEFDYVVFHRISDPGHHHLAGANDIANPMFQVECWGTSPSAVDALADAVTDRLDGYSGPFGTHSLQGAFRRDRREEVRSRGDQSNRSTYVVQLDFELWFTRL